MKTTRTSSRKHQHINISLNKDVSFRTKAAGFDSWDFQHNALPELNLTDIDLSTSFLGKSLALPFIVSSMTGGYAEAERINCQLAEICAQKKIGLGVGSQRQALEDTRYHRSFQVAREVAPAIPLFGNIGAAEVATLKNATPILRLIESILADGFVVHLNPLQELLQPEGNTNFYGVLAGIEMLVKSLPVPVIVKEIGAGISADVARRLINVGVKIIDVAGAGGTSWAGVEILRSKEVHVSRNSGKEKSGLEIFWDWGIPTIDALMAVCSLKSDAPWLEVIASGGIASGMDVAKSIALGADYAAAARPILKTLKLGGVRAVLRMIDEWEFELKGAMFLTGSRTIADLQKQKLYLRAKD